MVPKCRATELSPCLTASVGQASVQISCHGAIRWKWLCRMVAREFGSLNLPQALWEPSSFLNLHVPLVVEDGQQKLTVPDIDGFQSVVWVAFCSYSCLEKKWRSLCVT